MLPDLNLPEALKQYEPFIRQSLRPYIKLRTELATEPLSVFTSKIGGKPFWLQSEPYPVNKDGQPLFMLSQINFAEMPRLDGFPQSGLMQWFINVVDIIGWCDAYHVQYWEEDTFDLPRIDDFSFREESWGKYLIDKQGSAIKSYRFGDTDIQIEELAIDLPIVPNDLELQLTGELAEMLITYSDYHFEKIILDELRQKNIYEDLVWDYLLDQFNVESYDGCHQLGGYPYHTQHSPLTDKPELEGYELLFQIATEDCRSRPEWKNKAVWIGWGDTGLAQLFIHPDDLKRKDFSKVFFSWDCY